MSFLIRRPWDCQPQVASQEARQHLSNLWRLESVTNSRDLIGGVHLTTLESPTLYSSGIALGGTGLRGDATSNGTAKGLRSTESIVTGTNTSCGFAIFTLQSIASDNETTLFRATPDPGSAGVAINVFCSSKRIRSLLSAVKWESGNDRTESRLSVNVPWFVGYWYATGLGFFTYTAPIGQIANPLGATIGENTATVGAAGVMYVGGMSAGGAAFPGVIHAVGYSNKRVPLQWFREIALDPERALFEVSRIFVPMSAAAGGTFKAAWARNSNSVIQAAL